MMMIYNLNEKFTKVEERKGMLENKSVHSAIEFVVTDGIPEKDTGIELQPKEKIPFTLDKGNSLYVRCSDMSHAGANLAVINFGMPVMDGSGAITSVPKIEKFDIAGTYEWTVPQDAWYEVTVTGAGGAGGNAMITAAPEKGWVSVVGGSGGAGRTAQKNIYLLKDTVVSVKVGKGGENTKYIPAEEVVSTEPGGEESFFGNHCSATGGGGGQTQPRSKSVARRTGNGGVGKNGDINIFGGRAIAACSHKDAIKQELHFYSPGCSPSIYGGGGNERFKSGHGQNGVNGAGGEGAIAQLWDDTKLPDLRNLDMVNKPFYGGNGGDGVVVIKWTKYR